MYKLDCYRTTSSKKIHNTFSIFHTNRFVSYMAINDYGITIDSIKITEANYAPEIIQQMLMKQQAEAYAKKQAEARAKAAAEKAKNNSASNK